MTSETTAWLDQMAEYLRESWGLSQPFSREASLLYLYFYYYGLQPRITSGFRSAAKQAELSARYAAGDPSIVVKPAGNSKHSITRPDGTPAAEAIDISTTNPQLAAQVATALTVGAGYYFSNSDPVHYYRK
jgi:hypothetical protein